MKERCMLEYPYNLPHWRASWFLAIEPGAGSSFAISIRSSLLAGVAGWPRALFSFFPAYPRTRCQSHGPARSVRPPTGGMAAS
jgi:hypothetical protein